jgi:hypothetical protein
VNGWSQLDTPAAAKIARGGAALALAACERGQIATVATTNR